MPDTIYDDTSWIGDDPFNSKKYAPMERTKARENADALRKAAGSLLVSTAKRGAATFTGELSSNAPNVTAAYHEITGTVSDLRNLGREFSEEVKRPVRSIRHSAAKLLPMASKFLPPKMRARLEALATKIDVPGEETPEDADRRRSTEAENAVSAIFRSQIAASKAYEGTVKTEGILSRTLTTAMGNRSAKLLGQISGGIGTMVRFQQTTYTAYLKKSLELRYKHLFVAQDSLTALLSSTKILDTKLEAIRINTGLSEQQKAAMMQAASNGNLRRSVTERIFSYRNDFIKNFRNNIMRTALDLLGTMAMAGETGTMAADMEKEFGDLGPQEDYKTKAARAGGSLAGGFLGGHLGRISGVGFVRRFRPLIEDIDSRIAGGKTKLLSKLEETRQNWYAAGGVRSIIAGLMPDMSSHDVIANDFFDNAEKPSVFDNATRLSIVEVMPGWLSMIHHELAKQNAAPGEDVKQLRYNKITRGFTTTEEYRKDVFSRMLGEPAVRGQFVTRSTGIMKGAFLQKHANDETEYDRVSENIRRVFQNLANAFLTFDPQRFQQWLSSNHEIEESALSYSTTYMNKAMAGVPKGEVVDTIRTMLMAVSNPDGSWDEYAIRQLSVPHLRAMEDDKFRMMLPRVVNTLGDRDLFQDLVNKQGIINQDAMARLMLSGDPEARNKTITAESSEFANKRATYDANMQEFKPYLDKVTKFTRKIAAKFKTKERILRMISAIEQHADTITDTNRRQAIKDSMAAARVMLEAYGDGDEGRKQATENIKFCAQLLNMSMNEIENLAFNAGAYLVSGAKKAKDAAAAATTKLTTKVTTAWAGRQTFFDKAKAVLSVLKDSITSSPKYKKLHDALSRTVDKVRGKVTVDGDTVKAEAKLEEATAEIANSGDVTLIDKLKNAAAKAGNALKQGANNLLGDTAISTYHQEVLSKFEILVKTAEQIAQNTKPNESAKIVDPELKKQRKHVYNINPFRALTKEFKDYRAEQEKRDDRTAAQLDVLTNLVTQISGVPTTLLGMLWLRAKRFFHGGGKAAWELSKTAVALHGRVLSGALKGAGHAIGGTARGLGWVLGGTIDAVFGTNFRGVKDEEQDRYVDLYFKDHITIGKPVISAKQQQRGLAYADTGAKVESSYELAKSTSDIVDLRGRTVLQIEDRTGPLVTVYNKPPKRPSFKPKTAVAEGSLARTIIGGTLKGGGGILKGFYGGLFGLAKTALFGRAPEVKEVEPYIDVYVPDDKGNIVVGKPALTKKQQEHGVYRKNGSKIERSEDINEPVYKVKKGQLDLSAALISEDDIKRGLVDVYGKPLSNRKIKPATSGTGSPVGGLIGGVATLLKRVIAPLAGHSVDIGGTIVKLYTDLLRGGVKGVGSVFKGSKWLFNRLVGRYQSGDNDPLVTALTKLYTLIDKRTKDLDIYIQRMMPPEIREGSWLDQERDQAGRGRSMPSGTVLGPDGKPITMMAPGTIMGPDGNPITFTLPDAAGAGTKDKDDKSGNGPIRGAGDAYATARAAQATYKTIKGYGKVWRKGAQRAPWHRLATKLFGRQGLKWWAKTTPKILPKLGWLAKTAGPLGTIVEMGAGAGWTGFSGKRTDDYITNAVGDSDSLLGQTLHSYYNMTNPFNAQGEFDPFGIPIRMGGAIGAYTHGLFDLDGEGLRMAKNARDVGRLEDRLRDAQIADLKKWNVPIQQQAAFMQIKDPAERDRQFKILRNRYRDYMRKPSSAAAGTSSTSASTKTTTFDNAWTDRQKPTSDTTPAESVMQGSVEDLKRNLELSRKAQEQNLEAIRKLEATMQLVVENTGILKSVDKGIKTVAEKPVLPPMVVTRNSSSAEMMTSAPILDIGKSSAGLMRR